MTFRTDKGELLAGLIIAVIGSCFLFGAFDYRVGTIVRMGPGYLPMAYGAITLFLGLLIMLLSLGRDGEVPRPSLRAALAVLLSIASFGLFLPRVGLIPAILVAVLIAMRGDPDARLKTSLILAGSVALAAWLVFIEILGLTMHALRLPF